MTPQQTASDDLLAAVAAALPWLRELDEAIVSHQPGPERWSIKEVIGHLIDSAANNHQRFVRAQFVPELIFPKYEQNEWVSCQHYQSIAWSDLLALWERYNLHLAHVMRHVPDATLATRCLIGLHEPVTLQLLIEDYVVHLKHHLQKIAERSEKTT